MVAGAGRASTHDSRVQVQAEHEVGGGGLGPEATPALAKAARALHRALLRIVTVVSCRGKTHNNRPYLSVGNSNLLQQPLFWLDLHSSVTKSTSLLSFCSAWEKRYLTTFDRSEMAPSMLDRSAEMQQTDVPS